MYRFFSDAKFYDDCHSFYPSYYYTSYSICYYVPHSESYQGISRDYSEHGIFARQQIYVGYVS